jgi:hypothetical protein
MKKIVATLVIAGLAIAGFSVVMQNSKADCVNVYVDFGPLDNGSKITTCIPASGETEALDILASANLVLEGTREYGNAVVCRINDLPNATAETCDAMPPEESYWAVLIKEHEVIPMPFNTAGEWGWAQTGINEIHLHPGDSIGLVFADNGEVTFP